MPPDQGTGSLALGEALTGRYRIQTQRGGWTHGRVYAAFDPRGLKPVTIFVWDDGPEIAATFLALVSELAKATAPHLVRVREVAAPEGEPPFIVTEALPKQNIPALLRERGPLPAAAAIDLVRQLCTLGPALASQGLRLSDCEDDDCYLGPGLDGRLEVAVLPFTAIDRRIGSEGSDGAATRSGGGAGFSAGLAPEQIARQPVDARTDVYRAGHILYQLVSGEGPPWGTSGNPLEALANKLNREATRLNQTMARLGPGPGVSSELDDLVAAALARDTSQRPATLAALSDRLARTPEVGQPADLPPVVPVATGSPAPTATLAVTPPQAEQPASASPSTAPQRIDDDVQFTLYRPTTIAPERWETLLVYTHKSKRDPDQPDLDPLREVAKRAQRALGDKIDQYAANRLDASASIPRMGEITLVPEGAALRFNPPRVSFLWLEPVHANELRVMAERSADGQVARGRISAYFGPLLIAEIPFAMAVASGAPARAPEPAGGARLLQRVFPSYSHLDAAIVELCGRCVEALGLEYLRDVWALRSGDRWEERLRELIQKADLFQLFWSRNSMRSPHVRAEWELALAHGGAGFIRPVFWEDPFPEDEAASLPPPALRQLHFARLAVPPDATSTSAARAPQDGQSPSGPAAAGSAAKTMYMARSPSGAAPGGSDSPPQPPAARDPERPNAAPPPAVASSARPPDESSPTVLESVMREMPPGADFGAGTRQLEKRKKAGSTRPASPRGDRDRDVAEARRSSRVPVLVASISVALVVGLVLWLLR